MKTELQRTQKPLRELLEEFESGSRPKGGVSGILEGIPSLGGEHLNRDGGFNFEKIKFVPHAFAKTMTRGHLKIGDVLVVKDGATTGKVSLVRSDFPHQYAVINEHVFRLQIKEGNQPAYVFYFLYSQIGQQQILSDFRGAAQGGISQGFIDKVFVPIVPPDEQRRIVSELEKQFTRLEAGVAALRRVQANLKRYRAAVLKAACEGRLVPTEAELTKTGRQKSKFETGEELLARILTERRKNWQGRGKYKELAVLDIANLPPLPKGWTWASLDQLLSLLRNGISAKPDAESGLPILRISAVRPLSVNLAEARYLDAEAGEYPDYTLNEGDLLFTRYNGNPDLVGACGVVPPLTSPLVHPDKLIRCKLASPDVLPDFVAIMANVGVSRDYLAKRVRTTAGQAGISGGDLKGLPVPLAPAAEQTRIVAEVERRLSVVEELEAVVSANLQRATRLRQSILQKAFVGTLI